MFLLAPLFPLSLSLSLSSLSLSLSLPLPQGIVKALTEYKHKLLEHKIKIFVRRGGPNYQEGLRVMREVGEAHVMPLGPVLMLYL